MKYKLSKYIRFYNIDGELCIYNSLRGFKARIFDDELLSELKRSANGYLEAPDNRLVKAGVLVPENRDETVDAINFVNKLLNDGETLRLILLPTRECNFRCTYCYEEKRTEFYDSDLIKNIIRGTIHYLQIHPQIKALHIEWFGGEPMLCFDQIVLIARALKEYCDNTSIAFWMSMTTNGYLLTSQKAKELAKLKLTTYQITLDGNKHFHDELRVLKNGDGTWDRIHSNLMSIKETDLQNIDIRIRINYHTDMLERLPEILLGLKADFDDPRFHFFCAKINPPSNTKLKYDFVSNKAEILAQDYIFDVFAENNIGIEEYYSNLNPAAPLCYARNKHCLVIDVDGTIRKCTEYLDDDAINKIGFVNNGIFDIDEKKHRQWLSAPESAIKARGCISCKDLPVCYGGTCPAQWLKEGIASCNTFHPLVDKMMTMYFASLLKNRDDTEEDDEEEAEE
ncbi:MAG: radical SAM protein [Clostridia bacterium]|nr:radical SAM protein [Clostridia bacterium]